MRVPDDGLYTVKELLQRHAAYPASVDGLLAYLSCAGQRGFYRMEWTDWEGKPEVEMRQGAAD